MRLDQTELLYKIADIIGERAAKDYEQRSLQGYVSLATIEATAKPLVFSNVSLKWSPKHKAFYSEGSLGMSNAGRNDINGAFEGFMEVKKTEDGLTASCVEFTKNHLLGDIIFITLAAVLCGAES